MKDRAVHRHQTLRVVIIKGIMMEEMGGIQSLYHTFHMQKANHCPSFFLGGDRQWSCYVKRSLTFQRLREKMSGTLH
ncbi:hypothetical protein TNCV_3375031 [Trichonephila clavipes]|nr:hypothetical protein TNCV_3375031 [Trichonephila clavipes]